MRVSACVLALAAAAAQAQSVFGVTEPWVRPAAAHRSTVAYMELMSSDGAALIGARSQAAVRVSLQDANGKTVTPLLLALPARERIALARGGYRLVLHELKRPLQVGARVPITLTVRAKDGARQAVFVDAEVRLRSPTDDHLHPLHPHAHH